MAVPPVSVPWRRDPRLAAAVLGALLAHGGLLFAGSPARTYDAYVHIFFAEHYVRDWFSTWEPGWYTGFTVTSYPPGSHQAIAVASRIVGLETGFAVVQLAALVALVVGVYRFARCWTDDRSAGWAALLTVASSSVAEAVHVFGQLPTTVSLALLLNAQPSIRRWIVDGDRADLLAAIALVGATTASHHVTTLFGSVFFTGPTVVRALLDRWGAALPDEVDGHAVRLDRSVLGPVLARRIRRVGPATWRVAMLGVATVGTLVVVVLPYWLWSSSDPITQVPIPHGSRSDFLDDTNAGLVFWLVPWASVLLLVPVALVRASWSRMWPLAASVTLLLVLGTGGTTPIPRLLLGGAFDILTLDRFTIWATIAVLPLIGTCVTSLEAGRARAWLAENLGRYAVAAAAVIITSTAVASSLFAATLSQYRPLQPAAIEPAPIADFLAKDDHDRWRYLTLGFGDQMAWVAANTTALTVDGNYHSARRLPELITRPVERLEGAKFSGVAGIGSLQQFLGHPSRYHLKWVFSVDAFYDPLLWASGWQRLERLSNDVIVWERPDVPPLPTVLPSREIPSWQRLAWGTLPMTALMAGAAALVWIGARRPLPRRLARTLGPHPHAGRRWQTIDWRLVPVAARAAGTAPRVRWSPLARVGGVLAALVERAPSPGRRRLQQGVTIALIFTVAGSVLVVGSRATPGPADVVIGFYDDLDFQDFDGAWERLDPAERSDRETYLLATSVRDGLRDGYAELDRIDVTDVTQPTDNEAVVRVSLSYVTSLSAYDVVTTHRLVRRDDRWYLTPEPIDRTVPPEQLVRRVDVDHLSQGRRRLDSGPTAYADVLDRPRIRLGEARLVRWQDRWVVVGDVTNESVDPAQVTIEAVLRDRDGAALAVYEATQVAIHQVLPLETVPFRVEIEGRAGADDAVDDMGRFRPDAFTQPILDAGVASVELSARAVVSTGDLDRSLSIQAIRIADEGGTDAVVRAELRNDGLVTATVPHVLVTLLDDGAVAWVDHLWLPEGVLAQRSVDFELVLTDPSALTVVDVPIARFDNAIRRTGVAEPAPAGSLPLSPTSGFDGVRIDAVAFHRSPPS